MWAVVKHTPLPYLPCPPRTEVICYGKGDSSGRGRRAVWKKGGDGLCPVTWDWVPAEAGGRLDKPRRGHPPTWMHCASGASSQAATPGVTWLPAVRREGRMAGGELGRLGQLMQGLSTMVTDLDLGFSVCGRLLKGFVCLAVF